MSNRSPLAVWRPLNTPPYQEAIPWSISAASLPAGFPGAIKAGVALATGTAGAAVAAGRESTASACTVRVEIPITIAANATDEAPANSHIRSEDFELVLLDSRRSTIYPFY
jgi:hypothetical protein